jgi:predicted DCC family thiol-disulfide oxidoreductase YuxK
MKKQQSIVFFDGVCNLCNSSIDFVIRHDSKDKFLVGALQDELSKQILSNFEVDPNYLDSIILLEDNQIYYKSTAALKIARNLSGITPLLYPFIFLPKFLRDPVYDWIGRNRYKWFGKKSTCRLPTPAEKAKFLNSSNSPYLSKSLVLD